MIELSLMTVSGDVSSHVTKKSIAYAAGGVTGTELACFTHIAAPFDNFFPIRFRSLPSCIFTDRNEARTAVAFAIFAREARLRGS